MGMIIALKNIGIIVASIIIWLFMPIIIYITSFNFIEKLFFIKRNCKLLAINCDYI